MCLGAPRFGRPGPDVHLQPGSHTICPRREFERRRWQAAMPITAVKTSSSSRRVDTLWIYRWCLTPGAVPYLTAMKTAAGCGRKRRSDCCGQGACGREREHNHQKEYSISVIAYVFSIIASPFGVQYTSALLYSLSYFRHTPLRLDSMTLASNYTLGGPGGRGLGHESKR